MNVFHLLTFVYKLLLGCCLNLSKNDILVHIHYPLWSRGLLDIIMPKTLHLTSTCPLYVNLIKVSVHVKRRPPSQVPLHACLSRYYAILQPYYVIKATEA